MANLQNWISQARKHWREHQPTMYRQLKADGTLEMALKDAALRTLDATGQLESQGVNPAVAFQMVREQYLYPPEEAETPEPEAGPGVKLMMEALRQGNRARRMVDISQDLESQEATLSA